MRRLAVVLLPCLLAGCAVPAEPVVSDTSTADPVVSFRACGDERPAAGSTHLDPPATTDLPPYSADVPGLSGPVRLQHVLTLSLPTGSILAGNGADAVWAAGGYGFDPFVIAGTAVDAQVTLAAWEPGDDRRVAWLELSFGDADPVRWETATGLGIGTDGGDGGFWSPAAPSAFPDLVEDEDGNVDHSDLGPAFEAYQAASFPEEGPDPLCVVRATDGVEDGIVFHTGIGDGWYPTYAGHDAEGRVVSLLSVGGMDWATAGVPGTPPPDHQAPDAAEDET